MAGDKEGYVECVVTDDKQIVFLEALKEGLDKLC